MEAAGSSREGILVVSAWVEDHGELRVRIRDSRTTEPATASLFASRTEAVAFVDRWLTSLLDDQPPP